MSKKFRSMVVAFMAALLAMSLGLVGCSGGSSKTEDAGEAATTTQDTQFVVGFDQNFPPFGYVDDNGEFAGFDLELAAEVAKRNNWEVVYTPIDWDAKDLELSSGTVDCIWNGFTYEGREDGYEWTDPYMLNAQVIVVRADSGITDFDQLAGKVVMTQADSAALELLNGDFAELTATFASLETSADYNSAFMELEAGAVDAVAVDSTVAAYHMSGNDTYIVLDEHLSDEHYAVGFLKGNTELRDTVQATLMEMAEDGTFAEISKKYFDGVDVCILGK
ncbi:MAG: amino acid ABC transporter substrate-binding protein [Actinobacteria bacterium]|nr:amino acid ABC transporter substrate-binding protein [Actinomycetota bacterium]